MNSFISNSQDFIETKSRSLLEVQNLSTHPDYVELVPQDEKQSIGIKEIQNIVENTFIKPFNAPNKVFVIRSAHLLTEEAQNALLKVLEEPPQTTYFFLETNRIGDLLITIRSRCHIEFFDLDKTNYEEFPALSDVLKTSYEDRFKITEELLGVEKTSAKLVADKFLDKMIIDSQEQENFPQLVTATLDAKKQLSNNATPKNVIDLYFLKLPA